MDKGKLIRLRKIVVTGFALSSLVLVILIWVDQFTSADAVQSDYVRSTYSLPTSEGWSLTLTAQPKGQGQGEGQGGQGGQGGEHGEGEDHEEEITPSPTFDASSWTPDPEDDAELLDE